MSKFSVSRDLKIAIQLFALRRNPVAPSLLTWPFMLIGLAFFIIASQIYKVDYFEIGFPVAATSEVLGTLPFIALTIWYRTYWKKGSLKRAGEFFKKRPLTSKIISIVLIFSTGALRGASTDLASQLIQPREFSDHFAFYLLEGVSFTYYVLVYITVTGANRRYTSALTKVSDNLKKYEQFVSQQKILIQKETESLRATTVSQIAPKLAAIFKAQKQNNESIALLTMIEDALKNTVRPLGNELFERSKNEFVPTLDAQPQRRNLVTVPKRLSPKEIFNPTIAILVFSPLYILGVVVANPDTGFLLGAFQIYSSLLVAHFLKKMLPSTKLRSVSAFAMIFLIGFLVDIPSTLVLYLLQPQDVDVSVTYFQAVGVTPIWFAAVGYLLVVYLNVSDAEQKAKELAEKVIRQGELLKQKIWVERRNWSYLVHGTIQSSLTAIMVRLSNSVTDNDAAVEELRLVLKTIKYPPKPNADLLRELEDLEQTWKDVADLSFDIKDEALKVLTRNPDLRFATNEILKEAVSNAVRHGSSNNVCAKIEFSGDYLLIDVSNEYLGRFRVSPKSLGSKMFDELTTNWSLTRNKKDGFVHLKANLFVP